jgi:hypothetical protein
MRQFVQNRCLRVPITPWADLGVWAHSARRAISIAAECLGATAEQVEKGRYRSLTRTRTDRARGRSMPGGPSLHGQVQRVTQPCGSSIETSWWTTEKVAEARLPPS